MNFDSVLSVNRLVQDVTRCDSWLFSCLPCFSQDIPGGSFLFGQVFECRQLQEDPPYLTVGTGNTCGT